MSDQYHRQQYLLLKQMRDLGVLDSLKENHCIIAGGAIRALFANENISDYDIYFKSIGDRENLQSLWSKEKDKITVSFTTENAISYSCKGVRLQIIVLPELICSNPIDILHQFDYTVCMGAYDFSTQEFILDNSFMYHLAAKELHFNPTAKYPLASLFRLRKYIKKGYNISGSEIIKLGLAINNLHIANYVELKKHLEGIDTLFLKELTEKLLDSDFSNKKYDFEEFLHLIDDYYQDKLDEVMD